MSENTAPQTGDSDQNLRDKPRKIGCITIMWVVALLAGFLVWFNAFREAPLRISPETTYITEPLTADGKRVDYRTALKKRVTPVNIATDENGYRMVFQRLGDSCFVPTLPPETLRLYFEELGLDPNTQPDMRYLDFYMFVDQVQKLRPEELHDLEQAIRDEETRKQEEWHRDQLEKINANEELSEEEKAAEIAYVDSRNEKKLARIAPNATHAYNICQKIGESDEPHTFPIMQRWVEENGEPLDLIAEALTKPLYFAPVVPADNPYGPGFMTSLGGTQQVRSFAIGFFYRAKYRVGAGDFEGAVDDILACHRLGRHTGSAEIFLEAMVGIAVEGMATAAPLNVNPAERASLEPLERLLEGLRNLPPRVDITICAENSRYIGLDAIQEMSYDLEKRAVYLKHFTEDYGDYLARLGYNWNHIARKYNESCDAAFAGTYTPTPLPTPHPLHWLTMGSRSDLLGQYMSHPSLVEAHREYFQRAECADNMRLVTLAMLIYERRNGTLPPAFSVDENDTPLHSWRVHLLPYLGDESLVELHSQIRLDEPWDSEHNRQFHSRNIDVYRCPSAVKNDGEANYSVIVGDDLAFGNDGKGQSLDDFKRHMILLVERKEGVCWMKPDSEITQHMAETDGINTTAASIGSNHTGGANFGLRDGSVSFLIPSTFYVNGLNEFVQGSDTRPD